MASTVSNIWAVGEQAGSVAGPVQRSTKVEQFYGKIKVFSDQIQRIIENDDRKPSGTDVLNVLKFLQQTLLSWIKEEQDYFDKEARRFVCQDNPSVDFNLLCTLLLNALKEAKQVTIENQDYVYGILTTIACLVPFLPHKNLLSLPTKIASLIVCIPTQSHSSAVSLICEYLLPLVLGAMPANFQKEQPRSGLSSPALLLSIFQGCTDQSFYLKIVETLMTYKRNLCGDLLYVMAYGTSDVLEPAIHMLNRYCPAVEIGTVAEYRMSKQQNVILERCDNPRCAERNDNGSIRTAELVCLDPKICAATQGSPPPCFLCAGCAESLNQGGSPLFVDIVRSIGNIAELCENPDCTSLAKAGMHFCFSRECTKNNRRKPMRLCNACNESLHGKGRPYSNHLVHSSLCDLWSMKKPAQTYLVDTMARLLKEAKPPFGERCEEMGIDIASVNGLQMSDKLDANYYKSITRSLHGLSLLKALSPIPPSSYNYEHMYRLLSMLFAWLEAVSFKTSIHVKIVEIVERYQTQAIDWINKVQSYDFDLYCDCLLPLPPLQARIGLAWGSLISETRQLHEGLQRISTLAKLGLLPEKVWERVFPFWMQEIKEKVSPDELVKFKVVLRRLFDTTSDVTPSYSLNFIEKKMQHVINAQRQEALSWLQMLSSVDVCLDVSALIVMFLESSRYTEFSNTEDPPTMFQFPDPQTFIDAPLSAGTPSPSPGSAGFTFPSVSIIHNTLTYYILLMDILIKQVSLQKINTNTEVNSQETFYLLSLLVVIADRQKEGNTCSHSSQKSCQYCQCFWIFYTQIFILLDSILPTVSDLEAKSITRTHSRSGSMSSSLRSKMSFTASLVDRRSLHRMESFDSSSSFDEQAPSFSGRISSTGVEDTEGEMSADDTVVSEGSQDSLQAWKNRIKGITDGSFQSMRANSIEPKIHSWSAIYDANPEIELTVLLLQHIFKQRDSVVLCNILKCISMTCIRGECLHISTREDMDLTHYLQTVLFIPSLWEMLQSSNSCLAQQAVPLLLHCICMPYGASRLCDEIETIYNNEDWTKRFSAVEKVSLLCQFITFDIIRDSIVAKSTLVHAFVYLISAIDDVHNAVAAKSRTMLSSINETAAKQLYMYMEEHFKYESSDRLMLLHAWRTLDRTLQEISPFSNKFFRTLLCIVITKAKSSIAGSSRAGSISSTKSDSEAFQNEQRTLIWSRALSSPANISGVANWINSGKLGMDRPRSSSVPLVLYKRKFTLQFDRQQSALTDSAIDRQEEVQRSTSGRRRRNWSPSNDPFHKVGGTDSPLLGGRIDETSNQLEEDDRDVKRKDSTTSSSTSTSSKSLYLNHVDDVVLHRIVCLLFEYLSNATNVNADTCNIEDLKELKSIFVSCLTALTSAKNEEDLSFVPLELRRCSLFVAFLFKIGGVLDCNPYVGQEFLPLTLDLMFQCIGDETSDYHDLLLADLDPPMQHVWLMNLLLILYKYEFDEKKSEVLPLIWTVVNTINSHRHNLCINTPKRDMTPHRELNTKSFPRRVKASKPLKHGSNRKRTKLERRLNLKAIEDGNSPMHNDSQSSSVDSRSDAKTIETSFIDQSGAFSLEDGQLFSADSESTLSVDEETGLRDTFNSQRCPSCHCIVTEYEEDVVTLCVVVLSTFIHRDPEMAAPLLMEILHTVSRIALIPLAAMDDIRLEFRRSASVARQFIRCVFVQLSPNGLFPELFRSENFDKEFFTVVVDSLLGFDMVDEMAPLKNLLQDFSSRPNREDRVLVLLRNMDFYLQCLPTDNISSWESILHDFESFFKTLQPALPRAIETTSLLQIIKFLLSIGRHYAKSLLPSFGNILSHILRKCDFTIKALHEICYTCCYAFSKIETSVGKRSRNIDLKMTASTSNIVENSKEREKHFLARAFIQDLVLTMKRKISMNERNVKKIIQLIYLDCESWFSFEAGDYDIKNDISKLNIGFMSCVHNYQQDLLDCIKHWDYRIKSSQDMKNADEEYLDDMYFPVQLKASLSQILALHLSLNRGKAAKSSTRIFAWLQSPPSQLGRIDIPESVANLRTLAWLLLGTINHVVDNPDSRSVIHLMPLHENIHLIEYVKIVLQNLVQQDIDKKQRHLLPSIFITFITCQLWTIYCECHLHFRLDAEADVIATVMEFWSQVTLTIVKLLNDNDRVKLEILIPFIKTTKGIANCCEVSFSRLTTLWCPLVQYFKDEIPEDLYHEFKELQKVQEKPEMLRNKLHDVVRYTRLRLAKLENSGSKFDHSSTV